MSKSRKPQKCTKHHQFTYHSAHKEGSKVEKLKFCLNTCLFLMVLALTLMNDATSLFSPSLSLSQSGCRRCVSTLVRVGGFGGQCRWCDWCRVTWFHVNASALREFTLDYAPHCARPWNIKRRVTFCPQVSLAGREGRVVRSGGEQWRSHGEEGGGGILLPFDEVWIWRV